MEQLPSLEPLNYEDYQKLDTISITESRTVYTCMNETTGTIYAMYEYNMIDTSPTGIGKLARMIQRMKQIEHPGILPVVGYTFADPETHQNPIVIYEYPGGENLSAIIDSISLGMKNTTMDFTTIMKLIYGILATITFLHENNIVHGDIQPSSIFLTDNKEPKIASVGILTQNPNTYQQTHDVHTMLMLSAEMFSKNIPFLTIQSDIYALAMLIYRVSAPPQIFKRDEFGGSFSDYIINNSGLPQNIRAFSFLCDFITQGWEKNPDNRPLLQTIIQPFKRDVLLYCRKLRKDEFNAYAETMEQQLTLSTSGNAIHPINTREGVQFQISLMSVKDVMNTKEVQDIYAIKDLGSKAKERAVFIILMQDALMEITPERFDNTCTWILKNVNFSDQSHLTSFINNLMIACKVRFKCIDIYCKMIIELLKYDTNFLNTAQIKELYLKKIFTQMLAGEPYPSMCSNVCLLRCLCNAGVYKIEEIIEGIKEFYYEKTRQKRLVCLIFSWFAKEIFERDQNLFKDVMELFRVNCQDVFFPGAYRTFYENFEKLKADDWKLFKENVSANPDRNTLLGSIFHDDLQEFSKIAQSMNLDEGYLVPPDTYEICCIADASPSLYMYTNVYGSNQIYEYIRPKKKVGAIATNYAKGPIWDKKHRMLPLFAAAGGKTSFFRRFANKELDPLDGSLGMAITFYQKAVYDLLIQKKYNPNIPDKDGRLPIVVSAITNNISILLDLLKRGILPNETEVFQRTALHAAAEYGNTDALYMLLDISGIDVNAGDAWGVTPLHIATDNCQIDSIRLLLNTPQVDVNARTDEGKTPLHIAVETDYDYIVKFFVDVPSVDVNAKTKSNKTPLHIATKKRNVQIVQLLLSRTDILLGIADKKGRTPYMIAVENEDQKLIEIFEEFANKRKQQESCKIF